jgi:hypothetical protein
MAGALTLMAAPAQAVPATATVTGTVIGPVATAPLSGATVVLRDASGARLASQPTGQDGAFTIAGVAPGVSRIGLETQYGAYDVATPITLAPGETRGVHLAMRQSDDDDKDKAGGGFSDKGALTSMIVTIVGFVAMGVGAASASGDDDPNTVPAASESNPE